MATSGGPLSKIANDASALCRRTWWVFLVGGIAGVAFGILRVVFPFRVRNLPERLTARRSIGAEARCARGAA